MLHSDFHVSQVPIKQSRKCLEEAELILSSIGLSFPCSSLGV